MSLRPDSGREQVTAGKRNRHLVIERVTMSQDEYGSPVESWATHWGGWGNWRRAGARETLAAAEIGAAVTDIFALPFSSLTKAITPKDRLQFEGRTYDIAESTELGARDGVIIKAVARADE